MSNHDAREALTIAAVNLESAVRRYKQTQNGRDRIQSRIVRKGATLYSVRRLANKERARAWYRERALDYDLKADTLKGIRELIKEEVSR